MLIIRTAEDLIHFMDGTEKRETIINKIQELAQQVVCDAKDMIVVDIAGLLQLAAPLPTSAVALNDFLHGEMGTIIEKWSRTRGYDIAAEPCKGPTLLWIRGSNVVNRENQIAILIFVRTPKPRHDGRIVGDDAEATTRARIIIRSPISHTHFAESPLEYQVGYIVILETEEELGIREGGASPGICMLYVGHRAIPREGNIKGNSA